MARRPLADEAIDAILDQIVDGTFAPGEALPSEQDLANLLGVSRPTMREAVRALTDRGILNVVHGRGTYVTEQREWRDLPTLINVVARTTSPRELGRQLTEVRRMIEVGACGLAAQHRTDEDLDALRTCLADYDRAAAREDIEEVVRLDLDFHECIIRATGNPFLAPVMHSLTDALQRSRRVTSAQVEVRERATRHHRDILRAIKVRDAEAAKNAMRAHMTQTRDDIVKFASDH